MQWLVHTALKLRVAVMFLVVFGTLQGLRSLRDTPLDVFPEFAPPLVEIQTEAPGLSTEEVEGLITVPLEQAMSGTSWLRTLRSKSVLGLSSVVMLFEPGTDLFTARQLVQERLARVTPQLPAVAHPPVMLSPLSSTSRVMKIGITSDSMTQVELSTLARWVIRPRLMAVQGVANVAIWGQRDLQLQVLVDPERLRANDVTIADVTAAAGRATAVGAGGFVDTPNQRLPVTVRPVVGTAADLSRAVIAFRAGSPLLIGDVADVVSGFPTPIGDAVINDRTGLLLIVEKQPWGNTLQVTHEVEAALETLKPGLRNVTIDATIFRPATFIEMSLHNLKRALILGCVLVVIVLVVFLYDWRTAVISLVAIPLSLLAAATILRYRGAAIDTMVLAGLIIALGEVVDDAIIDVENIVRRLRLARDSGSDEPAWQIVLHASLEVRSAVVFGTMVVGLVFLPVFFLDGLAGSFFRPLALAYVLAVAASLLVALTVTPALSLILLPGAAGHRESPFVIRLRAWYRRLLPKLIHRPKQAVITVAVSLAAAGIVWPLLGESFLPNFREYDFLMHFVEKPGTSLEAMRRITIRAGRELLTVEGVRNHGAHIGRAEVADEVVGPNFTELWISMEPGVPYDATVAEVQAIVDGYPGLNRDLLTYLRERVKEVLSGASATIVVRLYGGDLATLRQTAQRVKSEMESVEGLADLKVEQQVLVPQIEVRLRPEAAAAYGLTAADVLGAASTLLQGQKVGEVYRDQMVIDAVVRGVEETRRDPSAVRNLLVQAPTGAIVRLGDVADVAIVPAPNQINRENASRRIDVTTNVRNRDLGAVARDIEQRVRAMQLPTGYHAEFLGEYAARQASRNRLMALGLLSLAAILVLLYTDFGSVRLMTLVVVTLPFALVGGVLGAVISGGTLSLGSLVGFVTVLGIAARNGIMLVSHYRHLEEYEQVPFGEELVLRGAEERLAPILMTALATALALVPIALGGDQPGHEIEHPMAVVILGGLISSTILNLFVMPALYLRYGRRGRQGSATGMSGRVD